MPVDAGNRPLAAAVPPPLLVSASEVTSYSTRYLGLVEVTFENRTAVWKQVDRVSLDFGSAANDVWAVQLSELCRREGRSRRPDPIGRA